MLPILLNSYWTGYLNTPSLHQGKTSLEKSYREVSCLSFSVRPSHRKQLCTTHIFCNCSAWKDRGGVNLGRCLQALPGPDGVQPTDWGNEGAAQLSRLSLLHAGTCWDIAPISFQYKLNKFRACKLKKTKQKSQHRNRDSAGELFLEQIPCLKLYATERELTPHIMLGISCF